MSNPVCWHELMTSDVAGAKDFYGKVFGWGTTEMTSATAPGGKYYMFTNEKGVPVAGMLQAPDCGPPSQWIPYMHSKDVPDVVAKVEKSGGTVMMPVTDVGPGTMAMFKDPQKAIFAAWKSKTEAPESNDSDLIWSWECMCSNSIEDSWKFYSAVFDDWEHLEGVNLVRVKGKKDYFGGMIKEDVPPSWLTHIRVEDFDKTVSKCREFNAKILVEPCDTPNLPHLPCGRLTVLSDPQGAVIGIFNINSFGAEAKAAETVVKCDCGASCQCCSKNASSAKSDSASQISKSDSASHLSKPDSASQLSKSDSASHLSKPDSKSKISTDEQKSNEEQKSCEKSCEKSPSCDKLAGVKDCSSSECSSSKNTTSKKDDCSSSVDRKHNEKDKSEREENEAPVKRSKKN